MHDRIEEEVGQHLPVRSGIAAHRQIGLAFDIERQIVLSQGRAQAQEKLLGEFADVESATIRKVAIHRHLLERLYQIGRAIEIGDQLRRPVANDFQKIIQARSLDVAPRDLVCERRAFSLQASKPQSGQCPRDC